MTLDEKLVYLRKEKRLSQLEVAEKLKVSRQAVSRWEVGASMPSIDNLKCLGDLYGVSMEWMLDNNAMEGMGSAPLVGQVPERQTDDNIALERKLRERQKKVFVRVVAVLSVLLIVCFGIIMLGAAYKEPENYMMENLPHEKAISDADAVFQLEW